MVLVNSILFRVTLGTGLITRWSQVQVLLAPLFFFLIISYLQHSLAQAKFFAGLHGPLDAPLTLIKHLFYLNPEAGLNEP